MSKCFCGFGKTINPTFTPMQQSIEEHAYAQILTCNQGQKKNWIVCVVWLSRKSRDKKTWTTSSKMYNLRLFYSKQLQKQK